MATPPRIPGMGAFVDNKSGAPRPAAPRFVIVAARLLWLAALLQLVASVFGIVHAVSPATRAVLEQQIAGMGEKAPSLEAMQNIGVITVVLAGLVTAGAYLLFSFYMVKGRSWARFGAGVLVALTIMQLVGVSYPVGYTTVAQVVLGGLAICLCYLPASNKFFLAAKQARA